MSRVEGDHHGQGKGISTLEECIKKHGKDAEAVKKCFLEKHSQTSSPAPVDFNQTKANYNASFLKFKFRECIQKAGSNHEKAQKCHEEFENATHKHK